MRVPSTEVQNNFGKYLSIAAEEEEVIVTRKGKAIARIVPCTEENVVCEEAAEYICDTDAVGRMTYEEFIEMTEKTDQRYELINGVVYFLASPNYFHQTAVAGIYGAFYNWFRGKKCRPLTSPFDVTLIKSEKNKNVVQPDIIVLCDSENVDDKGKYMGIPSLVVEVLSKSTRRKDMLRKLDLYYNTGIKEYWMVDPDKKIVYVYSFDAEDIGSYNTLSGDSKVQSVIFPGLTIELKDIFS